MKQTYIPEAIILRGVTLSDAPYILEVENNPQNAKYSTLSEAPYTLSEIRMFSKQCEYHSLETVKNGESDFLRFVVELEDGAVIGLADLYDIDIKSGSASVAIIIYPEECRLRGFGRSVIKALIDISSKELGLVTLGAEVCCDNFCSLHLFKRCGFTLKSTLDSVEKLELVL